MIAFPSMLVRPAEEAGIKVPEDVERFENYAEECPHFYVYAFCQLGSPMPSPTAHWDNAKVIANIPDDKIRSIYFKDLEKLGFQFGFPIP